jgi:erythromycin esterase-like protein
MHLLQSQGSCACAISDRYGDQPTRFGNELVTMGLVFNQGAFRASENNKGLREFEVKPASAGSMEAVLAAARIPLFAVDLRTADKKPVIDWLRSPQSFREIGSVYAGDQASRQQEQPPADAFDILFFIETTSPTHSIPPPVLPVSVKPSPAPSISPTQKDTKKPFWQIQ